MLGNNALSEAPLSDLGEGAPPVLSAAMVITITTTTAIPRVTITFA